MRHGMTELALLDLNVFSEHLTIYGPQLLQFALRPDDAADLLEHYRSLDTLQKIVEYQARFVDPGAGSVIANVIIDLSHVTAIRWGAQDAGLHRAA